MKFYFREDDDERCYLKKDIIEDMKENGPDTLKLFEAKRVIGDTFFWCTINQEIGEVGQGCGKQCSQYRPRNGKNGRCKFSGHCYEPTDISITITVKK